MLREFEEPALSRRRPIPPDLDQACPVFRPRRDKRTNFGGIDLAQVHLCSSKPVERPEAASCEMADRRGIADDEGGQGKQDTDADGAGQSERSHWRRELEPGGMAPPGPAGDRAPATQVVGEGAVSVHFDFFSKAAARATASVIASPSASVASAR